MFFTSTLIAIAGFLAVVPSALATISITDPSPSSYWVQNTSNTIRWQFNQGDPNPITITVTNPNNTFLNGIFSIAENVNLSNGSFTITNVTLKVDSGYVVNFVNGSNLTQTYAQSQSFDVKAPGTPQASQASSSASATATSPSGNGSATSSGASGSATKSPNASLRTLDGSLATIAPMLGMSALMAVLGAFATL